MVTNNLWVRVTWTHHPKKVTNSQNCQAVKHRDYELNKALIRIPGLFIWHWTSPPDFCYPLKKKKNLPSRMSRPWWPSLVWNFPWNMPVPSCYSHLGCPGNDHISPWKKIIFPATYATMGYEIYASSPFVDKTSQFFRWMFVLFVFFWGGGRGGEDFCLFFGPVFFPKPWWFVRGEQIWECKIHLNFRWEFWETTVRRLQGGPLLVVNGIIIPINGFING